MSAVRPLTHRPLFWIALAVAALAAAGFSLRFFTEAFPVAGIELEMDREGALQAARELAELRGWPPEAFRQAATFGDEDPSVRTYVELEAGVEDALRRLREEGGYHPYQWRVRHFREGELREVTVRFTPGGQPYGFRLTLPEDEPGEALGPEEARPLAEARARAEWGVPIESYELVESSQEARPGGRVDHTFVYLQQDAGIGDADFRLRLGVAGDELSEVRFLVRVPEAFSLRHEEMRAANVNLALVASVLFIVLFILGGCGLGAFHLVRTRWLEWRTPAIWGIVVAAFVALATVNALPLSWFGYDTAVSSGMFLARELLTAVGILILGGGFLALVFMVAEGLDRRAFPRHLQQWRLWTPDVARSGPAVGRTVGGYLAAAIGVGFVVAFYLFAMRREGWWMPSGALIQPDLLATYLPWLSAVSLALFSGFWEESVFRAIPVAGAALLGARFGRPGLWIGGALVLQAVLFAAAHADYPQQPSYARLLELVVPALVWGGLYLHFGLVPVILAHAAYNLSLLSIPLWVSSAPGIWMDRAALVLIGLVPLWIVLYHVLRRGFVREAPEWARNGAWAPPDLREPAEPVGPGVREARTTPERGVPEAEAVDPERVRRGRAILAGSAAAGALLWGAGFLALPDAPSLQVTRSGAEALARGALAGEEIQLDGGWRALPSVQAGLEDGHRFVWEEGGEEAFRPLLGTYLREPSWRVRFARFTGPVEERAEEYLVGVGPTGSVFRIRHQLPEEREGASLSEAEARPLAEEGLRARFGLEAGALSEVSADAAHRPARQDWSFIWSDTASYPLERGEARVRISLAGDRATDGLRFVHTPEEWDRERSARRTMGATLDLISGGLFFLLFAAAAGAGVVRWARNAFHVRGALLTGGILAAAALLSVGNSLPSLMSGFSTTQGFETQLAIMVPVLGVVGLILASAIALTTGFVHAWRLPRRPGPWDPLVAGAAIGLLVAGIKQVVLVHGPRGLPLQPSYGGAGTYLPLADPLLGAPLGLAIGGLFVLLVLVGLDRITGDWGRRPLLGGGLLLLAGLAAPGPIPGEAPGPWLLTGLLVAGGLLLLLRAARHLGLAFVPSMVATVLALDAIREASWGAYPGASAGRLLEVGVLTLLAWGWTRLLSDSHIPASHSR